MTDKMVEWTGKITEYKICGEVPTIDLVSAAIYTIGDRSIEIFDSVEDHLAVLKKCFDFAAIKKLIARPDFSLTYDSMCGVQGPYALRIIEEELGAKTGSCKNA